MQFQHPTMRLAVDFASLRKAYRFARRNTKPTSLQVIRRGRLSGNMWRPLPPSSDTSSRTLVQTRAGYVLDQNGWLQPFWQMFDIWLATSEFWMACRMCGRTSSGRSWGRHFDPHARHPHAKLREGAHFGDLALNKFRVWYPCFGLALPACSGMLNGHRPMSLSQRGRARLTRHLGGLVSF